MRAPLIPPPSTLPSVHSRCLHMNIDVFGSRLLQVTLPRHRPISRHRCIRFRPSRSHCCSPPPASLPIRPSIPSVARRQPPPCFAPDESPLIHSPSAKRCLTPFHRTRLCRPTVSSLNRPRITRHVTPPRYAPPRARSIALLLPQSLCVREMMPTGPYAQTPQLLPHTVWPPQAINAARLYYPRPPADGAARARLRFLRARAQALVEAILSLTVFPTRACNRH